MFGDALRFRSLSVVSPLLASLLLLGLVLAPAGSALGAEPGSSTIRLRSVSLDTERVAGALEVPPEVSQDTSPVSPLGAPSGAPRELAFLVQFPGPPAAAQIEALERSVSRIYTYLPDHTYLVRAGSAVASLEAVKETTGARWIGAWKPEYALSPSLSPAALAARASGSSSGPPPAAGGEATEPFEILMIQLLPDSDVDAVRGRLAAMGLHRIVGERRGGRFSRLRVLATASEIAARRDALSRLPGLFWLDTEPRRVLLNDTTIWVGQSGTDGGQATPVYDRGIFGEGQIVGVLDTGVDPDMCYFRDPGRGLPPVNACDGGTVVDPAQRKVIAVDFLWGSECSGGIGNNEWDTQDHGTHVAGTAVGDDFANPLLHDPGDGMAPGAQLVMQDCGFQTDNCADCPGIGCPVVDLNPIFQQAFDQGARIHTNSWGDDENNADQGNYTSGSQDADEFMWNHKDFLLFFAAGNAGPGSNTVGSPSTAKNVVAVGATQRGTSAESMASFSSCGPTDDGRIKPDLTVPGQSIVSANSDNNASSNNCNTRTLSGTSMASPGAAGFAALVREYYEDGFYPSGVETPGDGFGPSAALVKATMINSAREMSNAAAIPGNCQGWGRLLLDDALHFNGDSRGLFVQDDGAGFATGSSGETRDFTFSVSSLEPLKVTLVWTDFPSTPAAGTHLVNDLDLTVSGPDGTFVGNVFSAGQSVPGGSADRVNTVEQVLLSVPTPGDYTFTVASFTVPEGPQPFALVISGDLAAPTGVCSTPPSFAGAEAAVDQESSGCGITVSWSAGSSRCPDHPDVTYSVHRSTSSGFIPDPANRIATCLTGTSFVDTAVDFGTEYFYIVRAEDSGTDGSGPCNGGNQDTNTVQVSARPTGGRTELHAVDFEAGSDGWFHSAANSSCTTGDWTVGNPDGVTNGGVVTQLEDDHTVGGVNAFFTQPNTGGAGTDDVDGGVCTGLSPVVDASGFAAAEVSLWWYHGQRDAGDDPGGDFFRIDLSEDGGSTFPTSLVSDGDVTSNAAWTRATASVSTPGSLRLRIQASDGSGAGDLVEGGLDDVRVEGLLACSAGGPCTAAPSFGGLTAASDQETATCGVALSWSAATSGCAENPDLTYTLYRSTTSGFSPGPATRLATCITGTSFVDSTADFGVEYFYVVRAEDSGTDGTGPCNGGNQDANTVEGSASPTGGRTVLHAADFEGGAAGWAHSASDSTCTTGDWIVGDPDGVTNGGVVTQLENDHTAGGVNAFFTQPNTGGAGTDDVDGGVCTGLSPVVDASAFASARVSLWWYHGQRDSGDDPGGDFFRIDLSSDGGSTFPTSLVSDGDVTSDAAWTEVVTTADGPGQLRLRIQASDGSGPGDLVEGGLDDVRIEGTAACTPAP